MCPNCELPCLELRPEPHTQEDVWTSMIVTGVGAEEEQMERRGAHQQCLYGNSFVTWKERCRDAYEYHHANSGTGWSQVPALIKEGHSGTSTT